MGKHKAGLHKGLSEILSGVSMPKGNQSQRTSNAPALEPKDYRPPKPLTPTPQASLASTSQQSATSTATPEPPPPAWSLPKIMPPKAVDKLRRQQAKGVGFTRIFKQIPWQIFHSRAARL